MSEEAIGAFLGVFVVGALLALIQHKTVVIPERREKEMHLRFMIGSVHRMVGYGDVKIRSHYAALNQIRFATEPFDKILENEVLTISYDLFKEMLEDTDVE